MERKRLNEEQIKIAKIGEIAYIFGQLVVLGRASQPFEDLEDAYQIYEEIYRDWSDNKDIKTDEEQAYITAYASRIITEKYAVNNKPVKQEVHKVIGIFSELDGTEVENFGELKKRLGLIGSLSQDVGDVELYYDNNGITYAIAHGSESYYGKRWDISADKYRFVHKKTGETMPYTNLKDMIKMLADRGCTCGNGYDIVDPVDNKVKCFHCAHTDHIDYDKYPADKAEMFIHSSGYDTFRK